MTRVKHAFLILMAAAALTACQTRPAPLPRGAESNPILVDADYDVLFAGARAVLRDHRFTIFREDPRRGEIVTEPMTGQQFWEYWRADSAGLYNTLESSMHTILRTIDVRVYPARDEQDQPIPGRQYLEVRAYTDRLSQPERAMTAVNQLPTTYKVGRGLTNALELEAEGAAQPRRVFLGRDALLEDWLIREMTGRGYTARRPPTTAPQG